MESWCMPSELFYYKGRHFLCQIYNWSNIFCGEVCVTGVHNNNYQNAKPEKGVDVKSELIKLNTKHSGNEAGLIN